MNHPVLVLVADKSSLVFGALQNWLDKTEFHLLPLPADQFIQVADYCRIYQPDILALAVRLLPEPPDLCVARLRQEYANIKIILVADDHAMMFTCPG